LPDTRIAQHAKIIVDHSCKVKKDDFVLIMGCQEARDLIVEIASELGRIGASYIVLQGDDAFSRAYYLAASEETLSKLPSQVLNLYKECDVLINLSQESKTNSFEMSDVPAHKLQVSRMARRAMGDAILDKRFTITLHPTEARAQAAGMSYETYLDYVYSAILRDWAKMRSEMSVLTDKMSTADRVRIVGKDTDISMSIKGRAALIDSGEKNLPGGEVYTSPVDASVNGQVFFDMPIIYSGHEINGCRLVFKDGVAVELSAEKGSDLIKEMLAVDDGARRLGELGIGMNRGISKFTKSILFDEKMGDTVHMAVGRSFEEAGGTNKSAIHIDMIKNLKSGGAIYFDDEPIYQEGKFVWEK
jgi:aminopeptidase